MVTMTSKPAGYALWPLFVLGAFACGDDSKVEPGVPAAVAAVDGIGQTGTPGTVLSKPLVIKVTDNHGNPSSGVAVTWSVVSGGGSVAPSTGTTASDGTASAEFTLGPEVGLQGAQAEATGLDGSPVQFTATAASSSGEVVLSVIGGGNNVPER